MGIDYYFTSPMPLPELGERLGERLGVRLTATGPDGACGGDFLSMPLHLLGPHMLVNDGELNFEEYQHRMGLTSYMGAPWRDLQLPGVLMAMHFLHLEFQVPGMLVYNTDLLLARYVRQETEGASRLVEATTGADALDFDANYRNIRQALDSPAR